MKFGGCPVCFSLDEFDTFISLVIVCGWQPAHIISPCPWCALTLLCPAHQHSVKVGDVLSHLMWHLRKIYIRGWNGGLSAFTFKSIVYIVLTCFTAVCVCIHASAPLTGIHGWMKRRKLKHPPVTLPHIFSWAIAAIQSHASKQYTASYLYVQWLCRVMHRNVRVPLPSHHCWLEYWIIMDVNLK